MKRSATIGSVLLVLLTAVPLAAHAADVMISSNITSSETWTANNTYILTQPIYVTNGATLTIEPGTVVRGEPNSAGLTDPGTLIITRDSKIRALGTPLKPIVFTDLYDDNIGSNPGTFPYDTLDNVALFSGQWGGLILLGRGYVANNTASGPSATREVQIEGLTAAGGLGLYGNCAARYPAPYGKVCDDDDSGVIRYVSIRYGGYNLSANNEINGITFGGVGRNTDLDYIEVYQTKDDLAEFFGGAVYLKHFLGANGGDDGLDYDEGFRGKIQFAAVLQGRASATEKSDKGGEWDGGNGPDGSLPRAIPTLYNLTFVGLGQKAFTGKAVNTAMHIRDNGGGRIYNSAFLDFGGTTLCIESGATASGCPTPAAANTSWQRATTPYVTDGNLYLDPPSDFELEFKNNAFWCFGNGGGVGTGDGAAYGCDSGKAHCDPGVFTNSALDNSYRPCTDPLPIRALVRGTAGATDPDPIIKIDPRPVLGGVLAASSRTAPDDGFFEPVAYKGAFSPEENWAEGWSTISRLGYFPPRPVVTVDADITTSLTWTADNEYQLAKPIYVTNGATLTIEPGTVVRGEPNSSGATDPGTLIITRDSKIQALGTPEKPIVFTDLYDDNVRNFPGTAPYDTLDNIALFSGQWGGLILLGRGYVANNTASAPSASREVQIEGLTAAGGLGLYGNCAARYPAPYGKVCDDDDSGTIQYASIRYGGYNLSANNEINGITFGAVGRNTDLDYIEVYQTKDDLAEFFGGAVYLKHFIGANGGDDGLDYDEGFRGKIQFAAVLQGRASATEKSDKGGEWDGGNGPDGSLPRAIPTLYNLTFVGLGQKAFTGKAVNTAMHIRDNGGGRIYNSAFLDFGGTTLCIESGATASGCPTPAAANTSWQRATTPYVTDGNLNLDPPSDFELEFKNNAFWCFGNGGGVGTGDGAAYGCDSGKAHCDPGVFSNAAWDNTYRPCTDPLPIRALVRGTASATEPDPIVKIDPRPVEGGVLVTTPRTYYDDFIENAPYRGAFSPASNWATRWSTLDRLGYFPVCDSTHTTAIPDEVETLVFRGKTQLRWSIPLADNYLRFDLIRSGNPANFSARTCVETDTLTNPGEDVADLTATDSILPDAGNAFFYLVRSRNACGGGSLGPASNGTQRSAPLCD